MKKEIEKRNKAMYRKTKNPWDLVNPFPYDSEGRMIKGVKITPEYQAESIARFQKKRGF